MLTKKICLKRWCIDKKMYIIQIKVLYVESVMNLYRDATGTEIIVHILSEERKYKFVMHFCKIFNSL